MDIRGRTPNVVAVGLVGLCALAACGDEAAPRARRDSLIQQPITTPPLVNEDPHAASNACLSCHAGIEFIRCSDTQMFHEVLAMAEASGTNNRCVLCHGGNPEVRGEPNAYRAGKGRRTRRGLRSDLHAGRRLSPSPELTTPTWATMPLFRLQRALGAAA